MKTRRKIIQQETRNKGNQEGKDGPNHRRSWLPFLLASCFLCLCSAAPAADIADVSDLAAIKVQTDDIGTVNAGDVKSTLANYPALAPKLMTLLAAKLDAEDELRAKARLANLAARGVAMPQSAKDKVAARVEALRAKKEAALLKVKDTDPPRALAKLNELLALGLPVTAATQAAVRAAQPAPAPAPAAPAVPDDGL